MPDLSHHNDEAHLAQRARDERLLKAANTMKNAEKRYQSEALISVVCLGTTCTGLDVVACCIQELRGT